VVLFVGFTVLEWRSGVGARKRERIHSEQIMILANLLTFVKGLGLGVVIPGGNGNDSNAKTKQTDKQGNKQMNKQKSCFTFIHIRRKSTDNSADRSCIEESHWTSENFVKNVIMHVAGCSQCVLHTQNKNK
jgi:hypothetical protein